jgi:hypothetical protein
LVGLLVVTATQIEGALDIDALAPEYIGCGHPLRWQGSGRKHDGLLSV